MRGHDEQQASMFSYIAPEKLLRALLLQALHSVRSERLLMEQLQYNLLVRWFVGLSLDEAVWDVEVFTKNRERLLEGEVAEAFFEAVLKQAEGEGLLSDEHFTVDGTLIEAWANRKSFQEKKDPPQRGTGSGGRLTLRDTHESKSDAQARLYKKSAAGEARPSYLGHVVMENRNGLIVKPCGTQSGTREEPAAALAMLRESGGGDHRGRGQGIPGQGIHRGPAGTGRGAARGRVQNKSAAMAELLDDP